MKQAATSSPTSVFGIITLANTNVVAIYLSAVTTTSHPPHPEGSDIPFREPLLERLEDYVIL